MVFRTYCSQWPVDGQRHLRPPILEPGHTHPGDVVGRYQAAFEAYGDTLDAIVSTFEPEGYFPGAPFGPRYTRRGTPVSCVPSSPTASVAACGGIDLQYCAITDDGTRSALEYNCVRWGSHDLPPQAGMAVHERGPDGLLAAVRSYDDVEAPFERAGSEGPR